MNTRNTRNTSPNLLPENTYRARFASAVWDTLGDTPGVRFVVDIDHNGTLYSVNGALFFKRSNPDSKGRTSFDRSSELLTSLGWTDMEPEDFSPCIGKEVNAVVQHERNTNTGKAYHKVAFLNLPMTARAFKPVARDAVLSLFSNASKEDMGTPFDFPSNGDVQPGSAVTSDPDEDIAF